jgi:enoyl-CoA hydratase/carnithine racemase
MSINMVSRAASPGASDMSEQSATGGGRILVRSEGAVRVLTISRPGKKNSLTGAMYEALNANLDAASADAGVRALLLTGEDAVFTAGNDIGDFLNAPPVDESSPVIQFLFRLAAFEKPLLAAVDGPAVGIGTTLLLHTDDVIATERARFVLPFVNLGLVPEAGSSILLPALAGMRRASRMLLCGEPFDAQAALAIGLINEIVAPETLQDAALARAQAYASRPPGAMLASKRLLREPTRAQVREIIQAEARLFGERLHSQEAVDALTAFLTKKK